MKFQTFTVKLKAHILTAPQAAKATWIGNFTGQLDDLLYRGEFLPKEGDALVYFNEHIPRLVDKEAFSKLLLGIK
jgi:hypothetical protein